MTDRTPAERARLIEATLLALAADVRSLHRRLDEFEAPDGRLLTPGQLAAYLGTSTDFIYRHQRELGAIRLPDAARGADRRQGTAKPRLRFDLAVVRERLAENTLAVGRHETPPPPRRTRRKKATTKTGAPLLEIARDP